MLLKADDVGSAAILTPYNGQLRLLRQLLRCEQRSYIVAIRCCCQQSGANVFMLCEQERWAGIG